MMSSVFPRALGAAYLGGCALLIPNTLPIVLGGLRELYELSDIQVGFVNTMYTGACFLVSITAPLWLSRAPRALAAFTAAVALVVLCLAFPFLEAQAQMFAAIAAIGLAAGAMGAIGNATIGGLPEAGRWFGVSSGLQLFVAALYGIGAPIFIGAAYGSRIELAALAIGFAPCILAAMAIATPRASSSTLRNQEVPAIRLADDPKQAMALFAGFAALFAYVLAAAAFWIFIEQIGDTHGLDHGWIAAGVAAGIGAAGLGSLVFAWKPKLLWTMVLATAGLSCVAFGLAFVPEPYAFVASLVVFNIAWGIAVPAFFSAIRAVDSTNRLFVLSTAALLLGSAFAGPPAGVIMETLGHQALLVICGGILVAIVVPLMWLSLQSARIDGSAIQQSPVH